MFTALDRVWPLVGLAFAFLAIVCWMALFGRLAIELARQIASAPVLVTKKRYCLEIGKSQMGRCQAETYFGEVLCWLQRYWTG